MILKYKVLNWVENEMSCCEPMGDACCYSRLSDLPLNQSLHSIFKATSPKESLFISYQPRSLFLTSNHSIIKWKKKIKIIGWHVGVGHMVLMLGIMQQLGGVMVQSKDSFQMGFACCMPVLVATLLTLEFKLLFSWLYCDLTVNIINYIRTASFLVFEFWQKY